MIFAERNIGLFPYDTPLVRLLYNEVRILSSKFVVIVQGGFDWILAHGANQSPVVFFFGGGGYSIPGHNGTKLDLNKQYKKRCIAFRTFYSYIYTHRYLSKSFFRLCKIKTYLRTYK